MNVLQNVVDGAVNVASGETKIIIGGALGTDKNYPRSNIDKLLFPRSTRTTNFILISVIIELDGLVGRRCLPENAAAQKAVN